MGRLPAHLRNEPVKARSANGLGPPPPDFQGSAKALRTPRRPGCSASRPALSPSESIPGLSVLTRDRPPRGLDGTDDRRTVKEGREPSPGPPSMSLGSFTSPWCGLDRSRVSHAPPSRSRNLDLVPFRWRARRPSAARPLRDEHQEEGLRPLPTARSEPVLPRAHLSVLQNPVGTPAT